MEIAPSLHPVVEPNTGALTHEPRKIPLSPQGPIKPGRAHFQLIRVRNDIGHIQSCRYVPTHSFAVGQSDRNRPHARDRGGIDEEPHHPPCRFTTVHDLDEVESGVANVGLGEQPQVLNFLSHAGWSVFRFLFVSGLSVRAKKKGGHAAHPSKRRQRKFQGGVL